jgi:hypothetical protein
MVFGTRRKTEESQRKLNVQEVYALWDLLKAKYNQSEHMNIYTNLAHDPEFKAFLTKMLKNERSETTELENQFRKYKIESPSPVRKDVKTSVNTEILTDEFMAGIILFINQELIELGLRGFRSSTTNDSIRGYFKKFTIDIVGVHDRLLKYLKLKGWVDPAPSYPNIPSSSPEKINVGEVFNLWDHLTYRYTTVEITEIYHTLAQDGDFKLLLKNGIQGVLNKEIIRLENELTSFGIPFPKQPKRIYEHLGTVEIPDDSMFKQIHAGMQSAAIIHSQSLKQSSTNDRIRKIFTELLLSEMNVVDNVIKYGKQKGWIEQIPAFNAIK